LPASHRSGLLYALAGFACLALGDVVIKTMAGMWPPTAMAATRYVLGMIGLGAMLWYQEGRGGFAMPHPAVQWLRGAAVALAAVSFFAAVFVMPLAPATAILFTSPMLTALLAAVFLGEPMRRETWLASLFAFAGVLIVLRPNFAAAGWAALSALGMSVLMIGNRFVAGTASALAMQFFVAACASPILLGAALGFHFGGVEGYELAWPHWSVLARCALIACTATLAHWLIYLGTTRAGAASAAPMTYVQLLVAVLFGWWLFGDHPDGWTLLGAAVIVGSGLYLWRAGRVPAAGTID
jgi:drug/metabolite transporter (DMT)-like permease